VNKSSGEVKIDNLTEEEVNDRPIFVDEEDEDDDFYQDEKVRKPKGKKIKRMRKFQDG
jgi:hypothetical protein